jgi:hypothetical protein
MFRNSVFARPSISSQVSPSSCKRNRATALAVVVGLSGLAAQPALCQEGTQSSAVVLGRVLDAASGQPIVALEVRLVRNGNEVVRYTGGDGTFVFPPVQPGTYEIVLTHLAYGSHSDSVEAEVGELVNYEARLAMQPIELAPLTVTVQRRRISPMHLGFYERMALHVGGAFITREDIERRQPLRITHMIAELPAGRRALRKGCGVYVDRMYMGGVSIDREVLPIDVEAVEVYPGPASLPAEFSRSGCAIVIWTRRGTGG